MKARKNRGRPAVAERNLLEAKSNIRAKCQAMLDACETQAGLKSPDQVLVAQLPSSLRQFNAWSGKVQSKGFGFVLVRPNAPQTLRANADLTAEVKAALAARNALVSHIEGEKKFVSVARLRRDLKVSEHMRKILEAELIDHKRLVSALREEVQAVKNRLASAERLAADKLARLREQLADKAVSASSGNVLNFPKRKRDD